MIYNLSSHLSHLLTFPYMKKFLAIEDAKPSRGSYKYNIYRITRNELEYLGTSYICYASTRGQESEVMNWLSSSGYLPKKYNWYYHNFIHHSQDNNPFKISYQTSK